MMRPVFLVGPRGCGKTTTGSELARVCGCQFIDTDHWLQENTQMTVADIVAAEGWPGFRARETAALEAITAPATVVATGGGIILAEYNRRIMRRDGVVFYLHTPVSVLVDRLTTFPQQGQRPALTDKPLSEEVREVLAERDSLYRETAHQVVDGSLPPGKVVQAIRDALQLMWHGH